jgi:Contact-dependent growth inhibition CdiA C-terminal domain
MSKLNRLKFEKYPSHLYFKENINAIKQFRSLLNFEDALGYDHKSHGYIVLHKEHSPSGLHDEIPVCLILKSQGYTIELVSESSEEQTADALMDNILFEIKRLKKGTDLSGGIQNHFRRAKRQSENIILHIDHKVDISNLKRSIRKASVRYKNIKQLCLVYYTQIVELSRDEMQKGVFEI